MFIQFSFIVPSIHMHLHIEALAAEVSGLQTRIDTFVCLPYAPHSMGGIVLKEMTNGFSGSQQALRILGSS
jgi:hypothetical protein